MKIIKDFLPEEEFKIIEEQIFNEDFPWFFNDGIVDKGDGNFQLTHLLYHKKAYTGMKNSTFFDAFYPVFDRLNNFLSVVAANQQAEAEAASTEDGEQPVEESEAPAPEGE